jgi:predicted transcriptional regulator
MSSKLTFEKLREQAIALRRAGRSRREIKEILGIGSNSTLDKALAGEPPPEWTRRPRAKDAARAEARSLREQGFDLEEIATKLGVAKSSVSHWVRDVPLHERLSYEECRKRAAEGVRRYWEAERTVRNAHRQSVSAAAAAEIGDLSTRELLIAGAIAYWCEGAKRKEHRSVERVSFINSDPWLIGLYLRFLDAAGMTRSRLIYRLYIHETGDLEKASQFWLRVTGADPSQFRKPTLKRHNPKTVRKNVGKSYYGCLRIDVRRGGDLYRQIEGWAYAAMACPLPEGQIDDHRT